jgi:hypothetical protein
MYVLVRNDLAEKYRFVQGAHALAQFGLDHPKEFKEWGNKTIVFLGIRNFKKMIKWVTILENLDKAFSDFYEPDLDMQLTAIACYDNGEDFKKLDVA